MDSYPNPYFFLPQHTFRQLSTDFATLVISKGSDTLSRGA